MAADTTAHDRPGRLDPSNPAAPSPTGARLTLLRPADCAKALGVSTTTLWRWSRDPNMNFPQAFKLGANSVAFDQGEVVAWLAGRRVASRESGR